MRACSTNILMSAPATCIGADTIHDKIFAFEYLVDIEANYEWRSFKIFRVHHLKLSSIAPAVDRIDHLLVVGQAARGEQRSPAVPDEGNCIFREYANSSRPCRPEGDTQIHSVDEISQGSLPRIHDHSDHIARLQRQEIRSVVCLVSHGSRLCHKKYVVVGHVAAYYRRGKSVPSNAKESN